MSILIFTVEKIPDLILLVYKSSKTIDTRTRFFETAKALEYPEPQVSSQQIPQKFLASTFQQIKLRLFGNFSSKIVQKFSKSSS